MSPSPSRSRSWLSGWSLVVVVGAASLAFVACPQRRSPPGLAERSDGGAAPSDVEADGGGGSAQVSWEPVKPRPGERIVIRAAKPGVLHWGVNGWRAPASHLWPTDTTAIDEMAVETRLLKVDQAGVNGVALGPFPAEVRSIEFVLRYDDGTWDNNDGADFVVTIAASEPAPDGGDGGDAGEGASGGDGGADGGADGGTTSVSVIGAGNPSSVGRGARKTIVIDGQNTGAEWGSDTLLVRDPAADDARFLGTNWCAHEPPWDYAGLHAAWDDEYLYLGVQYVNVTDVLDPANVGSSAASIHSMDLVQFIAFNTIEGAGYGTGGDMWKKDKEFAGPDKPEFQLYFHSNFSQEGTYLSEYVGGAWKVVTNGKLTPELSGKGGRFYVGDTLPGVDPRSDDAAAGTYGAGVDFLKAVAAYGNAVHQTALDTFFELKVPLALLRLSAKNLDQGAIGVFAGNGDGSAVDSVPDDPATRSTLGTSASNSPLEWELTLDDDLFTRPFVHVGKP